MSGEDWLSDHLLGEQTESAAAEARRRLDEDPALRDRVTRLAEVAGRLDGLSPAAWEVASGADQAGRAKDRPVTAPWSGWRMVSPAFAAALLLVFALVAGVGVGALIWNGGGGGRSNSEAARTVALAPLPGTSQNATGSAQVTSGGQLTLRVDRLPATGAGRYYEAWLMTNARHLVPLASFKVRASGRARVTVTLPAPAAHYRYFDVSLQTVSGGTAHSSDSVLRGPTRS